ncbi:MAG TPA: hypothetical protein VHS59_06575 [Bacillota bacterium]|nr:hypothetical protein [Bacillota bacterium]
MSKILPILIERLTKDFHVLRDIYILMEEGAWLTKVALEDDDVGQVDKLSAQRQQYNEFIKAREAEIRATGELIRNLLGWQEFSSHRLLMEVDAVPMEELSLVTAEIQEIIKSLARIDMTNYHLQQGKVDAGKQLEKLNMLKRKASKAYLDNSFINNP